MNLKKLANIFLKILFVVLGFLAGLFLTRYLMNKNILGFSTRNIEVIVQLIISFITALIFLLLSNKVVSIFKGTLYEIEEEISKKPVSEIILSSIGLIIGLLIATLVTHLINGFNIGFIGSILSLIIYIALGYIGIMLPARNAESLQNLYKVKLPQIIQTNQKTDVSKNNANYVIDTSAIIDGRIYEICKTGFLEGEMVIPIFVLEELQHIADSSDVLKRNRGRRGLEVVDKLQNLDNINIIIDNKSYDDISEVDSKLVKMALEYNSKLVTNDFNLNKVATVQGTAVLNINELANAMKPIAIPGEKMIISIIKEGQELNQGIGYLDDGTMIVVENGKEFIGESKEVVVTSVLQTNAGKMIFAK